MTAVHAGKSLCTWTIVTVLAALPLGGCASGSGADDTGSGLSGGGGPGASAGGGTPAKKLKPKAKKGGGGFGGGSGGGLGGGGGKSGGGKSGGGKSGKSGGGKMKGYAFVERAGEDRHHAVDLVAGDSKAFSFEWRDTSGLAPAADLLIEADDQTVLQVSSMGDRPFAHAGVEIVPLQAGTPYTLLVERDEDTLTVSIVNGDDEVLIESHARATGDEGTADVVLPSGEYRRSVLSSDL